MAPSTKVGDMANATKPRRHMTLRVPFETYAEVRDLALSTGLPMAEVVRRAIHRTDKETR